VLDFIERQVGTLSLGRTAGTVDGRGAAMNPRAVRAAAQAGS
jgi:hypothetical protein